LILGTLIGSCRNHNFSGDGHWTDHGVWSWRPRYEIDMEPEVRLDGRTDEYIFRFTGMPRDAMDLTFRVNPIVSSSDVRANSAVLRVDLRDVGGPSLCSFQSEISELKVMEQQERAIKLWSPLCLDLKFDPAKKYELTVRIVGRSDGSKLLGLVPQLSGGGWDSL